MSIVTQRDLVALSSAPSQTERDKAARTHTAIREHLETDSALSKYRIDTFLQGSYKNSTNVRGDSDVDAGSFTNEVFYHDTSWLPTDTRYAYGRQLVSLKESVDEEIGQFGPGGFTFTEYRADVLASLKKKYGDSVKDGKKAIKVCGNTYRLDADVLPCMAFRQYYQSGTGASYHDGIVFFVNGYQRVSNFPHQHYKNLSSKDQKNDGKVKGTIRIVKRIRNELEESGQWDRKRSPSYYIEGLIWNVPDWYFSGRYDEILPPLLKYLWNDLTEKKAKGGLDSYSQANNILLLFHSQFWNVDDAIALIEKIWGSVYQ